MSEQLLIDGVEPLPSAWTDEPDRFYILSNGLGTNSYAVLAGIAERGLRLDANVFADTGDERPEIYRSMEVLDRWCERAGLPRVEVVRASTPKQREDGSLYAQCIRLGELPSKAYGKTACSMKWKITPQMQHMAAWGEARGIPLEKITRLIGFDADEHVRVHRGLARGAERKYREAYPLYEWGWDRDECVAAIARAGLPQPGKSACFYCPSSKKHEILDLRDKHPDLLARALEMERRAIAGEGQAPAFRGIGLGRSFHWGNWLQEYDGAAAKGAAFLAAQRDLMSDAGVPEPDCACADGSEALS
jgi:hypothetical protein